MNRKRGCEVKCMACEKLNVNYKLTFCWSVNTLQQWVMTDGGYILSKNFFWRNFVVWTIVVLPPSSIVTGWCLLLLLLLLLYYALACVCLYASEHLCICTLWYVSYLFCTNVFGVVCQGIEPGTLNVHPFS